MTKYTVTISSPESEKDFANFLKNHKDVEAISTEDVKYDPTIYDNDGNFVWINLSSSGLPVPEEYLVWRLEQSEASEKISWKEAKSKLALRRKELKSGNKS